MTMTPLSAQEAVCRLTAAAWDPQGLPAPESIPWPEALRMVGHSKTGGVVYAVTQPIAETVPPDVQQALDLAHYRSAVENTPLLHQLAHVREALSSGASRCSF